MNLRDRQKAGTRTRILDVARALFEREGFAGVNLRRIVAEAGCSTGAIFHNWISKDELFEHAMVADAPNPAAFARFVAEAKSLDEARAGAIRFLGLVCGQDRSGPVWSRKGAWRE